MTPDEIKLARERIAESRKICKAATEGPWFAERVGEAGLTIVEDGRMHGLFSFKAEAFDARFCAHSRTALDERNDELSAALDEIERLQLRQDYLFDIRSWHSIECSGKKDCEACSLIEKAILGPKPGVIMS